MFIRSRTNKIKMHAISNAEISTCICVVKIQLHICTCVGLLTLPYRTYIFVFANLNFQTACLNTCYFIEH